MKVLGIVFALLEVAHADFIRNDFLPVGNVRTDAIVNPSPGCLSDHVHTFYGPPLLYPETTYANLRSSNPALSSGNIEENNSLYWHPAVYQVAPDGRKTLQQSEMTTVYYNWIPGQTQAFPAGFRMITHGQVVLENEITPGSEEMEIGISFESCWDGRRVDSPNHNSHVAYPTGPELEAPCPASHPVRLPRLDFFLRWFNTQDAKWEFSDGTGRFHADYMSGWDPSFLQILLDSGDSGFDERVTYRRGLVNPGGDDLAFVRMLNANAVPRADTSSITTEAIDNVYTLPRGQCISRNNGLNKTMVGLVPINNGSVGKNESAPAFHSMVHSFKRKGNSTKGNSTHIMMTNNTANIKNMTTGGAITVKPTGESNVKPAGESAVKPAGEWAKNPTGENNPVDATGTSNSNSKTTTATMMINMILLNMFIYTVIFW